MTTITERVAAGAAFLDEHDREWWREIDLDALRLNDPSACVLGQRCPAERLARFLGNRYDVLPGEIQHPGDFKFWALAYELFGLPDTAAGESEDRLAAWFNAMGFNSEEGDLDEYGALTAEWKRVITERRSA